MTNEPGVLEVSRRIVAPAARIFTCVASPRCQAEFDGSGMLRGPEDDRDLRAVGDVFVMSMHRLGRDYRMINRVVVFERDREIAWEPAPGDIDTAGGDATRIGVPSGYRWGYRLAPSGDDATVVTSFFDCGPESNRWILENEEGGWINGHNPVRDSMAATLVRIEAMCAGADPQPGATS